MSISLKGLTTSKSDFTDARSAARPRDLHQIGRLLTSVFLGALLLLAAAIVGLLLYGSAHANEIYEGVTVGGVDVGGMSRAEARVAIHDELASVTDSPILLVNDEQKFYFNPSLSGIDVDVEATLNAAFAYGRSGSIWSRTQKWAGALVDGHDVPVQLQLDTAKIDATLQGAAAQIVRDAEPAFLTYDANGQPTVVPELPGITFDTEATRQLIIDRVVNKSSDPVVLVTSIRTADTTVEDLEGGAAQLATLMSAELIVSGLDRTWSIQPAEMQSLLSYKKGDETVEVDRASIEVFVSQIAQQMDQTAKDAGITVDENGKLAAQPGRSEVTVDQLATTDAVVAALQNGTHDVSLVYSTTPQKISDDVASAAAERGEELLNTPLDVTWDGGSITLDRGDLLRALTVRIRDGQDDPFVFGFDGAVFQDVLEQTFKNINVPVKEPRLRLVDGQIVPAQEGENGKEVDVESSIAAIVEAASTGSGTAELTVKKVEPTLSMPVISQIYLGDVLAESSTYYGDSSDARRQNVEVAAELQNGWLIAPGAQFSYAEFIGGVTADQGFVTGFGIVEDGMGGVTTAPVIGGGICQVSTTIFQAAFWSGLQIDERYSHPYWIQTYGEPPRGMKGLDAMVNIDEVYGTLDLKFTNTTGNWIAVQVIDDGAVLTTRILGTDPGWTVDISQPEITNVIKPDTSTQYTDSPELPEGTKLQVEYAQEGFSSSIHRTVTDKDGAVLADGDLVSSYGASENTILVGTGTATPVADDSNS
ncbi:MAG: VanW family protein [Thermomicrobiales bacterium]|nr:VanW family protein [Thermomicrobiales bacterium]MCO5221538.1 peptidoglycan binding domain-containing protein [Thermomicrobiales bacterium]